MGGENVGTKENFTDVSANNELFFSGYCRVLYICYCCIFWYEVTLLLRYFS